MSVIQRNGLRVVIGLGKTGLSCVRYLKQKGYVVAVNDTRELPPNLDAVKAEFPDLHISVGGFDQDLLLAAEEIIVSPGVSVQEPALLNAREKNIPIIGDIELFCRAVSAPIVAITGSNAKSTVTTLTGLMAQEAGINVGVGGNLGLPVLDMLLQNGEQDLYVLELSSFQLETTYSLKAAAAVVLNISEDHMDRYASMVEYHQAKHRIFRNCQSYVVNRDDALTQPLIEEKVSKVSFGLSVPDLKQWGVAEIDGVRYLMCGAEKIMAVTDLKIRGDHNVANALAALALGNAVNIPRSAMLNTLLTFRGLPHRCELIAEDHNIAWYNDSKGTNVGSTLAAINGLGVVVTGKLILILGGVGKGQDFSPLAAPIKKYVKALVLMGEDADKIAQDLKNTVPQYKEESVMDVIKKCQQLAVSGDAVVLSPACASFDMFKNYEDRGQQFVKVVHEQVLIK